MSEGISKWSDGDQVFAPPRRTLIGAVLFVGVVFVAATICYVSADWSLGDAIYMVTLTGETVGEAERRSGGAFFVVQIDRASGQSIAHPAQDVRVEVSDEILLVVRSSRVSAGAMFSLDQQKIRQSRSYIG